MAEGLISSEVLRGVLALGYWKFEIHDLLNLNTDYVVNWGQGLADIDRMIADFDRLKKARVTLDVGALGIVGDTVHSGKPEFKQVIRQDLVNMRELFIATYGHVNKIPQ
jgi:hypothetical protein